MSKRATNITLLFLLGLMCLATAINIYFNDTNIDLTKTAFLVGQVKYADVRQISKTGLRWNTHKRIFYFRLDNSNQNFAIHRSYEGYEDLKAAVNIGDSLKVYYRGSSDEYNTHVFQLEKDGEVLEDYKDYQKEASSSGGLLLLFGVMMTIASILMYFKFNLLEFLRGLVEQPRR